MYETEEWWVQERTGEKTSCEEGFIVMLSYFVSQDWRNKDDFFL